MPVPKEERPRPLDWHDDLAAAERASRATGRPLVVFARADWDVPSRRALREVWSDPRVMAAAAHHVALDLDATDTDDASIEHALARLAIERIPTIVVIDPRRGELGRHEGPIDTARLLELLRLEGGRDDVR